MQKSYTQLGMFVLRVLLCMKLILKTLCFKINIIDDSFVQSPLQINYNTQYMHQVLYFSFKAVQGNEKSTIINFQLNTLNILDFKKQFAYFINYEH